VLLLAASALQIAQAQGMGAECPSSGHSFHAHNLEAVAGCLPMAAAGARASSPEVRPRLIVIGFMGGRVKGNNLIHKEALLAKELQERDPRGVYAEVFANHKADDAFKAVMQRLGAGGDGKLSMQQKQAARVVIYGHSWGGSETVTLARRLNTLGIPVLLTVQIDSVQKLNEDDAHIPPNVREAINFYQKDGLLRGRKLIRAMDPRRTTILGNYRSSYRSAPIACAEYPWFARTFMKPHIEMENDPAVWERIRVLIQTKFMQDDGVAGE